MMGRSLSKTGSFTNLHTYFKNEPSDSSPQMSEFTYLKALVSKYERKFVSKYDDVSNQ